MEKNFPSDACFLICLGRGEIEDSKKFEESKKSSNRDFRGIDIFDKSKYSRNWYIRYERKSLSDWLIPCLIVPGPKKSSGTIRKVWYSSWNNFNFSSNLSRLRLIQITKSTLNAIFEAFVFKCHCKMFWIFLWQSNCSKVKCTIWKNPSSTITWLSFINCI